MEAINLYSDGKSTPLFPVDGGELERMAAQVTGVGSLGLVAVNAGFNAWTNGTSIPVGAIAAGEPQVLWASRAKFTPTGSWLFGTTHPLFDAFEGVILPLATNILSTKEKKVLDAYLGLLTAGAECVQANPGIGISMALSANTAWRGITVAATAVFESTVKPPLSDKAQRAMALLAEWRTKKNPERTRDFERFAHRIDEGRKDYRILFEHI